MNIASVRIWTSPSFCRRNPYPPPPPPRPRKFRTYSNEIQSKSNQSQRQYGKLSCLFISKINISFEMKFFLISFLYSIILLFFLIQINNIKWIQPVYRSYLNYYFQMTHDMNHYSNIEIKKYHQTSCRQKNIWKFFHSLYVYPFDHFLTSVFLCYFITCICIHVSFKVV